MTFGSSGCCDLDRVDAALVQRNVKLASMTCVRMHSKLKYEFELVCTSRSYRLRAPSAQALALWVTAISSEWLQLRNPTTPLPAPTPQRPVLRQPNDALPHAAHAAAPAPSQAAPIM